MKSVLCRRNSTIFIIIEHMSNFIAASQQAAEEGFRKHFGMDAAITSRAPGRLEILGNHTDYNQGTVLSVAVDRAMFIAASPVAGKICSLHDLKSNSDRSFNLDELANPRKGDWANYIKGLVVELQKRGIAVPAFNAVLYGTVPLSAGMSSSAALEMAMLAILNRLAAANLPWLEMARIGQATENNYIGANTGLMDQLSSLKGKAGCLIYSDFRTFEVENVAMPEGTVFVVANSMVKHNLTNEYNERREACEDAAATLKIPALRDATTRMLEDNRAILKPSSYRRALHVVGEIERVARGRAALAAGDIRLFGRIMSQSHQSSIENFENSCPEIDKLVEIGGTLPGFLGARLSGGGFGGISVHLVEAPQAESYMASLADGYRRATGLDAQIMQCTAADGAQILRG